MFFFHQKQSKRRRRICEKIEVHLSSARWNVGKSSTISLGDACKLQGPWKFEGLGRQTHASTWGGRAETTLPQWICLWWLFPWIFGRAGQRTCAHTHTHREHFAEPARQNRSAILSGKQKTCGFTPAKPHEPFIFFHQIVSVRNWKTQGAVFTGCWNSQSRVRVDIPPCFNKQDSPKSYAGKDGMLSFLGCLSRWCASLMQAQVLQRYMLYAAIAGLKCTNKSAYFSLALQQ